MREAAPAWCVMLLGISDRRAVVRKCMGEESIGDESVEVVWYSERRNGIAVHPVVAGFRRREAMRPRAGRRGRSIVLAPGGGL